MSNFVSIIKTESQAHWHLSEQLAGHIQFYNGLFVNLMNHFEGLVESVNQCHKLAHLQSAVRSPTLHKWEDSCISLHPVVPLRYPTASPLSCGGGGGGRWGWGV